MHSGKRRHSHLGNAGFATPSNHGTRISAPDNFSGFTDCVSAGGAGRDRGEVGATSPHTHGHIAGTHVGRDHGHEERAYSLWTFIKELVEPVFEYLQASAA